MNDPVTISLPQALGPTAPTEIRILPAGAFRSADGSGRPSDVKAWHIYREIASGLISASFAAQKELLIDYDHQSLRSAENGQIVPAAAWFSGLEWREGQGLFATAIQWNKKAKDLIAAREYRFISPVFGYDKNTGNVIRIFSVAITNSPALPDLFDLSQVAAASAIFERAALSGVADIQNQRGYELLARMSPSVGEFATRAALCTSDGATVEWSASNAAAPENQRGIELINRMSVPAR